MKVCLTSDLHSGFSDKTNKHLRKMFIKINSENPAILIIAGDLISHKQDQFPKIFRLLREILPEMKILITCGNHDFWSAESFNPQYQSQYKTKILTYYTMREQQRKWMKEFNIHYLSDESYEKDNVIFFGFDGYYKQIPPRSNDGNFMPRSAIEDVPIHQYLNWKANKQLGSILEEVAQIDRGKYKLVCVTHFNMVLDVGWEHMAGDPVHLEMLVGIPFDLILWGHNHKQEDFIYKNTRVVNSGSDYDKPQFKMIEV